MRFAMALVAGLGLVMVAPAAIARAETVCAEFNTLDEAGKLAAVQEAAVEGSVVAQLSPKDAVSLAIAMCRVRTSETVTQVLNSKV
ncbi:hypothetical protein [Mycobacteroides sp. LB1]|uniref:hypothetical protein n=1 Tax=Mycobacteroides sp. LB1 TaxID=2750814 RepID=UPI0015DE2BCE|nr:hypothetical protein [Mycobacteroides sp. LB1]